MANSEPGWSSDPARALWGEYQVFLNFRGPDTRHGFTDFLYHDLLDAGVRVFRDEDELRVGEVIGGNLLRAINSSMIYIPIFSVTYASSKWCLRELAHITDNVSQSKGKKSILPIFFHVKPEDVKLKTPLYSNALLEHEKKFPDEVKAWRKALAEVDEIKGWNVKKDQSQAKIVKLVVKRVLEKLELKQKSVSEHLVGLDDRVKHLTELLDVNHANVRLIGIYGTGGIGKTTIAKVVFNELSSHFAKCCSFLEKVREKMSTEDGIVRLQKKLLSDISDSGYPGEVKDSEEGMRRIGEVLGTKKVLVVLDDADNKDHIKKLIGNNSLHSGSRIIITTKNKTVLQGQECKGKIIPYEMLKMDDALALELFCQHAFGKTFPSDDYHWLSKKIALKTGGLPLAVEVIGSLLNGKDKAFWEETLIKLREVPEKEILEKLKISYDDLDECQQQIFLDIACFFFNKKKTKAIYMWASCQFYPERGINDLINKCLIKVLDSGKFWMHDQLRDMGRHIVRQESPSDQGKRSRLWIAKEALKIIKTEERKDKVQALEIDEMNGSIEITNGEFERLPNPRFLKLRNGTYAGDFAKCHSNLKWISWQPPLQDSMDAGYFAKYCSKSRWTSWLRWICCLPLLDSWQLPLQEFRANHMYLEHLVVFKLGENRFGNDSKAWDLIKGAHNLKVLSLSRCQGITAIPDFSNCLGLESLTLAYCNNLKRIESFIGDLQLLIKLKIVNCKSLADLPEDVGALVKLERFSLRGCYGLRELPGSIGNLTSLVELDVSGTGIEELPELPTSLTCLLISSVSLRWVPNLSNLANLATLQLCDGSHYSQRSNLITGCNLRWIERLSRLKSLHLNLLNVHAPPELASLSHLEFLKLGGLDLESLVQLPSFYSGFRNLSNLEINWCKVEDIQLYGLPQLEKVAVDNCGLLKTFSIPSELTKLRDVQMTCCPKLVNIKVVGLLESLECLSISKCKSLRRIGGLPYLKNLERLEIYWCKELICIEGLDEFIKSLRSLKVSPQSLKVSPKSLKVYACPSLSSFTNVSYTNILDDIPVIIYRGNFIKDSADYYERPSLPEVLDESKPPSTLEHPFTITFHLGVKKPSEWSHCFGGVKREKKNVTPDSVTYKGLIADVKGFGFRLKRMWYEGPGEYRNLLPEIKSDEQVKGMAQLASKRGLIHLYIEGRIDSEWAGEYDDEMMKMLREEWAVKTDVYSDEDWPEQDVSSPDEDSDTASVGERETDGTSSIDDF